MTIRDWLVAFSNDVVEVKEPVATDLEATRFFLQHPRQPVHLKDLHGGEAVGNLWSTRDRVATALRVPKADLLPRLMDAQAHPKDARVVERADFMRHETTDVDLRELPIPKLFPKDAGRYITAGVWVAEWEGVRNLSFHRILILGADRGACRIVPRHLRHMYNEAMKAGGELKVAVCIGLDPWNLLAGGTSVEYGVDESRIASALTQSCLGKPIDSVRIKSGLTVPAEAEYVLEGRLINEVHDEGPFVDAVRTYDRVRKEPVLVVDRIYHRDRPIFHIIVGGLDEHFMFMGMPREPVIYQAVSRAVPHVKAVRLTEGGCAWLHGVVSIRKQHQGDGKNAIMAAFGAHTSMTQRLFRHLRGSPAVFVTHELLRRETVEERAYQVNIARACLERSTLVVLPTGMGKTVIAAMVIAEVLRRRGGRILFLAPTKPLVEQHAASMRKVLVVDRITLFTGEATAPEDRELLWRENKIIVSTPQVIRNDVRAERISGVLRGEDPRGVREPRHHGGRDPHRVRPRRRAVPTRSADRANPGGSARRLQGNSEAPSDRRR